MSNDGTGLRERIAKAIADHIGHGMAEKCEGHADAVIEALSAVAPPPALEGMVWPKTDYGPEFDWLNSPGLPEQLAQLAAQSDDFGDRMTIFPCDARAILANLRGHISPSGPTGHEPPPDDIGPYPHGWDNYRDSSCLIADLAGADPVFRSGNEAD